MGQVQAVPPGVLGQPAGVELGVVRDHRPAGGDLQQLGQDLGQPRRGGHVGLADAVDQLRVGADRLLGAHQGLQQHLPRGGVEDGDLD